MALSLLNLDNSLPSGFSANAISAEAQAGKVRYLDALDAHTLEAMSRYMGDVTVRGALVVDKMNAMITVLNENPLLTSFDNRNYVLIQGDHPFVNPVGGVDPTEDEHLATKNYVDLGDAELQTEVDGLDEQLTALSVSTARPHNSDWVDMTTQYQAGVKQVLQFEVAPEPSPEAILALGLAMKLNIATPTDGDPDPDPVYIYRSISSSGSLHGYTVEDMWFEAPNLLKCAVPNDALFPTGYSVSSGYPATTTYAEFWLKGVVLTGDGTP